MPSEAASFEFAAWLDMILFANPDNRFSIVKPNWAGFPVVLVGGGDSLTEEQCDYVRLLRRRDKVRVIVINDGYLRIPEADVLYFADSHWWKWQVEGVDKPGFPAAVVRERFELFGGEKCTIQNSGGNVTDTRIHMIRNRSYPYHENMLSLDPAYLGTGRHSGFQALNLAILAGGSRGILLGFDAKASADGKTHWFGEHPRPTPHGMYENIIRSFSAIERQLKDIGFGVTNCSPSSAIRSFPRLSLSDALPQ